MLSSSDWPISFTLELVLTIVNDPATDKFCASYNFQSQDFFSSNTTSQLTCNVLVFGSYRRCAFDPGSFPKYTIVLLRSSNLLTCTAEIFMWVRHPKILIWLIHGFSLVQASYGVPPVNPRVGNLFSTYIEGLSASLQNIEGISFSFRKLLIMETTVPFRCSTTSFCCGEYEAVKCR